MKYLLLICIWGLSLPTKAQGPQADIFVFEGYIYTEDSFPVEDAHLINYRTTKIITTDKNGFFRTFVREGDSLMINHISLKPRVIHSVKRKADQNKFYVANKLYLIKSVSNNDFEREQRYSEKNRKLINRQVQNAPPKKNGLKAANVNSYDNDKISPGIDLRWIFKLFKRRK